MQNPFEYLQPTKGQIEEMSEAREAAWKYLQAIEIIVPNGPDKTYIIRKLREVAMWVNVAITRHHDASPRL